MPTGLPPISPAELTADLIRRYGSAVTNEGYALVVGPANDTQQQGGVISLMAAGLPVIEKYAPLQWHRTQARCIAGDLGTADIIAQLVQRDIHGVSRKLCFQTPNPAYPEDTGRWFLVHLVNVTAGPSHHYDSPETWESLLFAELMIGTDPVASGPNYPQ
jgi:hypothetical protein